jgi:hypothetical protein
MKNEEEKFPDSKKWSWIMLIFGLVAFASGFFQLFFMDPSIGVHLRTGQSFIRNGSYQLIIGVLFTSIGIYKLRSTMKK